MATVLVAIRDLMFSSRVHETAKSAGITSASVRRGEDALARAREEKPLVFVADLGDPSVGATDVVRAMKADAELKAIHAVGFASHVLDDVLAAARAAGFDEVLSKGAFTQRLPQLLAGMKA